MRNRKKKSNPAVGIGIAAIVAALCLATLASDTSQTETSVAVDAEQYADFIENEVFDIQDLAEGAEIQRRRFNRMTPPGFSWVQPMFPSVVPFDAENFDEKFLDELLGEDKNSVAIYPLSLTQDPKTRETLVYNAEGNKIATIPADRVSREWPEDADPARVTLLLDLLPAEDVEPFLYTESRIEESLSQRDITRQVTPGGAIARSLGAGEFGICGIRKTTNGTMLITVTNGLDAAEVYAYTVAHTSSVVVATWTNEYDEVITSTNVIWHPVSPPFNGIQSDWASRATNLVLTGGTGVWEDTNISSNDRVRFYAVANRGDQDGDGLSDGAEILLHRTNLQSLDTDGDGLLDGYDISVQMGDPRYSLWANQGILYSESTGMRLFRGELSAGSSPLDDDTDGDGLPDGWEVQNDLDPLDAEGDNGPEGDPDGDEFDNALERELGAPANNAAWNGNELAYRLMHATPVVVTNTRSITTNLIGMRVTVENSWDCETGGHPGIQNNTHDLDIPALLECGYYIDIHVEGSVEAVDLHYDQVSFEAVTNNLYFSSHDDVGQPEYCLMADEAAEKNNLIFANSTVKLRYNTAGYRWHSDAFAEIIYATNTGPYKVVVSGADVICVGETAQMEASGAAGAPYTWSANGDISVGTNGVVTGLAPGIATVIATDAGGCSGEKEIIILKVELESDKAVESPKPFDCGKTEAVLFNPCEFTPKYDFWNIVQGPENDAIDSSLTIYHDEVSDAAGDAQDFDIKLRVLPNDVPALWSLKSGPAGSGILTDAGQSEATFSNPTKGGRYIFTVVVGGITTDVQVWLPISGPDISTEFQSQINYIKNDWGPRYQSNLLVRVNALFPWYAQLSMDASTYLALLFNQKVDDLLSFGLDMDYELIDIGLISDVGGLANVEVAGPAGGDRDRFSMKGASRWYVTDFSKRSNMAYAMAARAMGFPSLAITEGPDLYLKYVSVAVGTRDTPAAKESYRAGIDLIDGQTLQQVLDARGRAMQAPSGRSRREWPDSTSASTTYFDLNTNAHTTMEALTVAP